MTSKTVDYIIAGQGLAGSCLALQLLFLNKKILVIDKLNDQSATKIAAGLFNPITGRKMTKTWMADELFSYLNHFYREAEIFTGSHFFFPMPLYRPFDSVKEQNEWMGRSADESFTPFIEKVHSNPVTTDQVQNKLGGISLKQCGYVNTITFSEAVRTQLEKRNALLDEEFNESLLTLKKDSVTYKEWNAGKIIFCTGEKIRESKFFSWLPVTPLKGETLTIKTEAKVTTIYNRGVYVVPDIWKVGATYNLTDQSREVTGEARRELKEKLTQLISFPFSITDQQWGMRPATTDRRPILGPHPEFEQLVIFNGLGTKGISLAPYFSEILTSWMEKGRPINNEVAIKRYKSLYWNSA